MCKADSQLILDARDSLLENGQGNSMADVLSKNQRSFCMSRTKAKDTKPELLLRKALWSRGLRYRLRNNLPGKPDIVFPGKKVVIFVDGCFCKRPAITP